MFVSPTLTMIVNQPEINSCFLMVLLSFRCTQVDCIKIRSDPKGGCGLVQYVSMAKRGLRRSTPTAIRTFQLRLHILPSIAMHEAIVDYVPLPGRDPSVQNSLTSRHGLRLTCPFRVYRVSAREM